jgi:hypothetical protein
MSGFNSGTAASASFSYDANDGKVKELASIKEFD